MSRPMPASPATESAPNTRIRTPAAQSSPTTSASMQIMVPRSL